MLLYFLCNTFRTTATEGRRAAVRQSGSHDTISRTVIRRSSPYVLLTAETEVITLEDIAQNVTVSSSYKIFCVYNIKYMEKSTGQVKQII